jgi:hypothetical protein
MSFFFFDKKWSCKLRNPSFKRKEIQMTCTSCPMERNPYTFQVPIPRNWYQARQFWTEIWSEIKWRVPTFFLSFSLPYYYLCIYTLLLLWVSFYFRMYYIFICISSGVLLGCSKVGQSVTPNKWLGRVWYQNALLLCLMIEIDCMQ